MTDPSSSLICPDCGSPLPPDSPQALCPSCLMRQALASRTVVGAGGNPGTVAPPSPAEIAEKFPQFEILECLGRGGMGIVYKARQKSLNRLVAIKILAPEREHDSRFSERFAGEAELLAKLSHPHIVTIHDFGQADGLYYLVMEYVDGVNLRDLLRDGKIEAKEALAIVPPICDALQFAHDKGIVHRDIKPENLLLDRGGRVKIADFGIAALVGAEGDSAGTPPYMAPEQTGARPEVDHRADIYALGVVLYEMLTGERPDKEVVVPSRKVRIDVRLDEVVLRALENEPGRRYQTAGEFRTAMETMDVSEVDRPPPPSEVVMTETANRPRRKKVKFRLGAAPSKDALLRTAVIFLLVGLLGTAAAVFVPEYIDRMKVLLASHADHQGSGTSGITQVFLGAVGVGVLGLIATLAISMVMVVRGKGSGSGKGLVIGCLMPVLGGLIVALSAAGAIVYLNSKPLDLPDFASGTAIPAPAQYAFAPVIEAVVEFPSAPDFKWFDLDTGGHVAATGVDPGAKDGSFEEWMREAGADIGAVESGRRRGLFTRGDRCILIPAEPPAWDSLAAGGVMASLASIRGTPAFPPAVTRADLPTTYVFRTGDGSCGLLQITDFTGRPTGVKIRYKVVRVE